MHQKDGEGGGRVLQRRQSTSHTFWRRKKGAKRVGKTYGKGREGRETAARRERVLGRCAHRRLGPHATNKMAVSGLVCPLQHTASHEKVSTIYTYQLSFLVPEMQGSQQCGTRLLMFSQGVYNAPASRALSRSPSSPFIQGICMVRRGRETRDVMC